MEMRLVRDVRAASYTAGKLYINGEFECFTLEDTVREPGVKVPGQTAIPAGVYTVVIDESPRFGKPMPHVLDVPDFTGVRIHPGNKVEDTEGCILVGKTRICPKIAQSQAAFSALFFKLWKARQVADPVTLEIVNG